jgi:hypothetical protein
MTFYERERAQKFRSSLQFSLLFKLQADFHFFAVFEALTSKFTRSSCVHELQRHSWQNGGEHHEWRGRAARGCMLPMSAISELFLTRTAACGVFVLHFIRCNILSAFSRCSWDTEKSFSIFPRNSIDIYRSGDGKKSLNESRRLNRIAYVIIMKWKGERRRLLHKLDKYARDSRSRASPKF